jgi:hypothetical protein
MMDKASSLRPLRWLFSLLVILDAKAQPFLGTILKLNKKGLVRLELRGGNVA